MAQQGKPDSGLARRVLPAPLYRALVHVFAQRVSDCMLVGGTALAGYYAGHRRSDDLDLFVKGETALTAAVLAVQSLETLGAVVRSEQRTAQFFSATCELEGHFFTAQVVADPNLFRVGTGSVADDGVCVASIDTLLKMKAATMVSRASEKDLYDLAWLIDNDPELDLAALLSVGAQIDGGVAAESMLANLLATKPRLSACEFALQEAPKEAFAVVVALKDALVSALQKHLEQAPEPSIGPLIRLIRRRQFD